MFAKLHDIAHFWEGIPAWKHINENEFGNDRWQLLNSVTTVEHLEKVLGKLVDNSFIQDVVIGRNIASMNMRVTPYILSLINWSHPYEDPIRKQFIPVGSDYLPDHPFKMDDSLAEDEDSPVPLITHRYPNKVLFLPLTACPVYCIFCTRSRMVGGSSYSKIKINYGATPKKWEMAFDYLRCHPQIEDVVISGGDAYQIPSRHIENIGRGLLSIPTIKRIRFGTKGLAVLPMKILSDNNWVNAIDAVQKLANELGKQIAIHTHFNHPNEITHYTQQAMHRLTSLGVRVRNQSVLLSGINNSFSIMSELIKNLISMNIEPYYIYQHDMVGSCEHLRTTLKEAIILSNQLQGMTSGFYTPKIVCDLPGGGGKRLIQAYESYNESTGISIWKSPTVKPGQTFYYYDPIHKLSQEAQAIWNDSELRDKLIQKVIG